MNGRLAFLCHGKFILTQNLVSCRYSKVPLKPTNILEKEQDNKVHIDSETLSLLERLSLVQCDTVEGVKTLEDSVKFANKILYLNTDNVQPLFTVLENENLYLRDDEIKQGNCQKDILKNAAVTEDDYFVAPPGNIPLHDIKNEIKNTTDGERIAEDN